MHHDHWQYILDGTIPVPAPDGLTWARWWETADRRVAQSRIAEDIEVSTVFLGLNHQWGDGPPLLFETMVFGGPLDEEQARYTTWAEAEQGHAALCAAVQAALAIDALPLCPPGSICEQCLDAPAVRLALAPWGGEMGICADCSQARALAALPALTAHKGERTLWHTIADPARLAAYHAASETPLPAWWDRCVTMAPARVCVCGEYRLLWEEEASASPEGRGA